METTNDIKTIRAAVERNRGGWEAADDAAIWQLWQVLGPETRKAYLESVKPPEKGKGGK